MELVKILTVQEAWKGSYLFLLTKENLALAGHTLACGKGLLGCCKDSCMDVTAVGNGTRYVSDDV